MTTVTRETAAPIRTLILCSLPAVAVGHVEWNGQDQKALCRPPFWHDVKYWQMYHDFVFWWLWSFSHSDKGQAGLAGDWTETWDWWALLACSLVSPPPRWPPRARRHLWCVYRTQRRRQSESCPWRVRFRPYTHRNTVRDMHTPTTAPAFAYSPSL